ncbi:hypothetical protein CDAR_270111 [Caerostris darwini]|uniref:Uncharacterized protein n=1 Tax=Caerostris darwini TaxID=1538125 RepID=A0AAV4RLC1_9ARAC|nr:hypothetical protein CDAR_270111 [Caerostris darwini]
MSKSCQKPNPLGVCGVMIVIRAPHLMDRKGFAELMDRWILETAWKVSIRRAILSANKLNTQAAVKRVISIVSKSPLPELLTTSFALIEPPLWTSPSAAVIDCHAKSEINSRVSCYLGQNVLRQADVRNLGFVSRTECRNVVKSRFLWASAE